VTGATKGTFKAALMGARPQIGSRTQIANTMVAEALGCCGFDYVYIDMEHSPADALSAMQQCQAVQGTPAHPVVRLPSNDAILIQKLLDLGVENFVVPMVDTAEQAKAAVAATRYPPHGTRSFARVHRGNRYGGDIDYPRNAADRICVIVQAETRAALANISAIAAIPGLDGVLFGPADLAADMGYIGDPDGPEVSAAIRTAIGAIRAVGSRSGMSTGSAAKGREWIAAGCSFVSVAGDLAMLVGQARRIAADVAGQ
jgi:2-keto-3-deoxy-L-rhamnonate aldolase RhmA